MNTWQQFTLVTLAQWLLVWPAMAQLHVDGIDKGLVGDAAGLQVGDIIEGWRKAEDSKLQSVVWPFDLLLAEEAGARRESAILQLRRHGQTITLQLPSGRWGIHSSRLPAPEIVGSDSRLAALYALESARQTAQPDRLPAIEDLNGMKSWHAGIAWLAGDVLADLQSWERAQSYWQHSQALITNPDQRALLTSRLARAAFGVRDIDQADELALDSLEFWMAQKAAMHVLQLHTLLGFNAFERRDLKTAEIQFTRAVNLAREKKPLDPTVISALRGLGQVRSIQGRVDEAVELSQEVVALAAKIAPETRAQAKALNLLAMALMQRQDLSEAESVFLQALGIVDRIAPQSPDAAGIRNNIATVLYHRHEFDRARYYYEQALAAAEMTNPDSAQVARTRYNIALTYAGEELHLEAAQQLEQVLTIQQQLVPETEDVARTLHSLAMRFDAAGNRMQAREYEKRALDLYRRILPDSYPMATSAHKLGQIELREASPDKARPLLEEAAFIARRDGFNTRLHAECAFDLAELYQLTGHTEQALAHYQEAVNVIESLQSRLGGSDEALSSFREYYAHFFDRLIEMLLLQNQTAKAFEVSERYRAQSFLALLNSRPSALHEQIPESTRTQYIEAQTAFEEALANVRADNQANTDALEQTRLAWQDARDRLRIANAAGQVLAPRFVDANEASGLMPEDTVILSFIAGNESLHVFALRRGQPPQHFQVNTSYQKLVNWTNRIRVLMAVPDSGTQSRDALESLLSQMGNALLGPVLANVDPGTQLVVLPDKDLWLLPFSALRLNDLYVAQQWPLQLSWSTTNYLDADSPSSGTIELVAFADPLTPIDAEVSTSSRRNQPLRSLPGALLEVERISGHFGNKKIYALSAATETAFREHAGSAAVVHVAAHAHTAVTPPLEAYLQLVPDSKHDGRLMVWEVMSSLQLDAQLVVLSGCATAMGLEVSGEGLMGLTRAFGIAGARRILASQWPVMDSATSDLMSGFYDARKSGLNDAEALQASQQTLIAGTASSETIWSRLTRLFRGQRTPDHSHPFYWAAFSLYGSQP